MKIFSKTVLFCFISVSSIAQGTRLLRQPTLSATHIAFEYGGDLWISDFATQKIVRLTSTAAVESNPHFSPDGKLIAFTSNWSGAEAIYTVSINGGEATRHTWHPSPATARGWSNDGTQILYSSTRETAPASHERLWTVPVKGGPSKILAKQWGTNGSYSPTGEKIAIDRIDRWDVEWRNYKGGQNTPLIILNLKDFSETLLPNERSTDIQPLWLGESIYFLSDRDGVANIWSYNPATAALKQFTKFTGADTKWLAGYGNKLAFEREGYLHLLDLTTNATTQLNITINGDFPWANTKWEDVSKGARAVSLSSTGKRAIMESRGEIFTIPVEHGDARNITQSSGVADREPIWSPKGNQVAWFSDQGGNGYSLMIADQDGLSKPKSISIGESKLGWEPTWSPDGKFIAFTDDDVRVRILDVQSGAIQTADVGGTNLERGEMGLAWSTDSQWLAYAKTGSNGFRSILVWSLKDRSINRITDSFADSFSPAWDLDGRHLYFLASTDLALGSGWANTSSMTADPAYSAYVINLRKDDPSPFIPRSDEETVEEEKAPSKDADKDKDKKKDDPKKDKDAKPEETKKVEPVVIDLKGIERRILALPIPKANYQLTKSGLSGSVFIGERVPKGNGLTLQKFTLKEREVKEFLTGVSQVAVSADGNKMLVRMGSNWKVVSAATGKDDKSLDVKLNILLDREQEWKQIFEEAWRYERDYFYDPNMHGRDWNEVHARYAPLIPFIKHRADLSYVLDQVNGELSVGHSFVFGGDFPEVEKSRVGLLGADLVAENKYWKINRIFTTESWNPELSSPLERPGLKIQEGYYLVGINGKELTTADDPFKFLDGTVDKQTVLHINKTADFAGSWKETVTPIGNENNLRQRAWVEDNRRLVDKLSGGRLAYVWVPNTGGPGFVSFNRYYFAQQDKEGAVIDERFNGGGLLDDYMVDLMVRRLRASLTNEVPNGTPSRLPAGILGPKVLLINEMAGSGGDFFPWVFRQQKVGPLIGARTWGGLVKSSVHYALVDGGALTAPDNAVFDPINNKWVAENEGVPPDIEVRQDAASLEKGNDPQLERAVKETLLLLEKEGRVKVTPPPFSTPAKKKN